MGGGRCCVNGMDLNLSPFCRLSFCEGVRLHVIFGVFVFLELLFVSVSLASL